MHINGKLCYYMPISSFQEACLRTIRTMMKKSLWPGICVLLCLLTLGILLYAGVIWPNDLFVANYPVRGVDVSSYQHQIDWQRVAQSGQYTFAYLKATEGTTYQDATFHANWQGTKAAGLVRGAYHYFLANVSGVEQANQFIRVVPKEAGTLPPMLDLEVAETNHAEMLREIKAFLDRLEQFYGVKPLIYTNHVLYTAYIQGHFDGYPLTIRDVVTPAQWGSVKTWTFWQYSDRAHVPGITGFVDLDAFYGQRAQLNKLINSTVSSSQRLLQSGSGSLAASHSDGIACFPEERATIPPTIAQLVSISPRASKVNQMASS